MADHWEVCVRTFREAAAVSHSTDCRREEEGAGGHNADQGWCQTLLREAEELHSHKVVVAGRAVVRTFLQQRPFRWSWGLANERHRNPVLPSLGHKVTDAAASVGSRGSDQEALVGLEGSHEGGHLDLLGPLSHNRLLLRREEEVDKGVATC